MTLSMDGVDINAIVAAQGNSPSHDPDEFWSSTARPGTSPVKEMLEFTLGSKRAINTVSFDVSRFPLTVTVEWWNDEAEVWEVFRGHVQPPSADRKLVRTETRDLQQQTPLRLKISESVPVVVNRSVGDTHPQHFGGNHWRSEAWKTTPVHTRRIRFVVQRNPDGRPPVSPFGDLVDYSVALRRIKIGYRIDSPEDLTAEDGVFESSLDILGSQVLYSLYRQTPERAVDGDTKTSWRSDPEPINYAVVPYYVDMRDEEGEGQVVDCWYVDPLTTGVHCNLYFSNDEPVGDFVGGRSPVPEAVQSRTSSPASSPADQISLNPNQSIGVSVLPKFLRLDLSQPWWLGIDGVALTGMDDTVDRPLASLGPNLLMQQDGNIVLLMEDATTLSIPLPVEHTIDSNYRVLLGYYPAGTVSDEARLYLTYLGSGYFYQQDYISVEMEGEADLRVGLAPESGFFSSYSAPSNLSVKGLVLKTSLLTEEVKEWFLDEGSDYVGDDLDFASENRGATTNAVLRMHPAFVTSANPFGIVGGDSTRIENNIWTPVPRDYVLRRGWMEHPPIKAKYFKFEFTQLSPRLYETFVVVDRVVRCFPLTVIEQYLRTGPKRTNESYQHGVATMVDGSFDGHTYIDALANLRTSAATFGPEVSSVLVPTTASGADAVAETGWIWQYQPWHSGSISPRWATRSRHHYENIPIKHRAKVAYYVGIKELRPGRSNQSTYHDNSEYVERFWTDGGFDEFTGFESLDEGGVISTSSTSRITSDMLPSRTPVQRLQFATMQTGPLQVLPDPEFEDPTLSEYLGYGDSTPEWVEPGVVKIKRFFSPTTNLVMENLLYGDMERYLYGELEGSSLTAAPIFDGHPQPPLLNEIGAGSLSDATPVTIRPHQISSNYGVPVEEIVQDGGEQHGLDPRDPDTHSVPGSVRWYSLLSPSTGVVALDAYLTTLSDGSWLGGSDDSIDVEIWAANADTGFAFRYRWLGRGYREVPVVADTPVLIAIYVNSTIPGLSDTATVRLRAWDLNTKRPWDPYTKPTPAYSEGGLVTRGSYQPMGAGAVTARVRLSANEAITQPVLVEIISGENGSGEVLASASKQIASSGTTEIVTSYSPPTLGDDETYTYGEIEDLFNIDPPEVPEPDYTPFDVGPGATSVGTITPTPYVDESIYEIGPGTTHPPTPIDTHQLSTTANLLAGSADRLYTFVPDQDGFVWIDTLLSTDVGATTWTGTRTAQIAFGGTTVLTDTITSGRHRYKVSTVAGSPISMAMTFTGAGGSHADIRVRVSDANDNTIWDPWAAYPDPAGGGRTLIGPHQVSINDSYDLAASGHRYYVMTPSEDILISLDLILTTPDDVSTITALISNEQGGDRLSRVFENGRTRNIYALFAGVEFRFEIAGYVTGTPPACDLILRVGDTNETALWSPVPTDAADYEVGPGSINPLTPKQVFPHTLSTSDYTYSDGVWLYHSFIPADSGNLSVDTYLTVTGGGTPGNWHTDIEAVEGIDDLATITTNQRQRIVGDVLAGERVTVRSRAYRLIDTTYSAVPTTIIVRFSDVGPSAGLWTPEPYEPPTETTYGFLEDYLYGQLESETFTESQQVSVRIRQQGITDDEFSLHSVSLSDDPVAWSYSVDDGQTWLRAPLIRNNPHGVFSLPESGNQLRWRVEIAREGVWLSELRIRPWYGTEHHAHDPVSDLEQSGPNDSAADNYPALGRHPLWTLPEFPVNTRKVRVLDGVEEQFWRNLVINPSGEDPSGANIDALDEGTVDGDIVAGGTSA